MIIGRSPAIRQALALVERFAPTTLPILLVGARGTGKELFAQEIHRRSRRCGELVDVNCATLPPEVADGLLFGFRRGIFTGATESHAGLIQQSDGGTLFLDELLGLRPEAQRKLLRVIETGEVRPLGERGKRAVDFRVVATVQEELDAALERGALREDLYDRLRGAVIELPPLAERREDVVPLARHFAGLQGQRLERGAARVVQSHAWPGNARELRLAICRAGCLVSNGFIPATAMLEAIRLGGGNGNGTQRHDTPLDDPRRLALLDVGRRLAWDWRRMADELRMSRATLYRRMDTLRISPRQERFSQRFSEKT